MRDRLTDCLKIELMLFLHLTPLRTNVGLVSYYRHGGLALFTFSLFTYFSNRMGFTHQAAASWNGFLRGEAGVAVNSHTGRNTPVLSLLSPPPLFQPTDLVLGLLGKGEVGKTRDKRHGEDG